MNNIFEGFVNIVCACNRFIKYNIDVKNMMPTNVSDYNYPLFAQLNLINIID